MDPLGIASYALLGAALGTFYFALLFRTVGLLARRGRTSWIVSLYVLRLAAAVAAFWIIAQHGALPLLSAAVGFVATRLLVRRWLGSS